MRWGWAGPTGSGSAKRGPRKSLARASQERVDCTKSSVLYIMYDVPSQVWSRLSAMTNAAQLHSHHGARASCSTAGTGGADWQRACMRCLHRRLVPKLIGSFPQLLAFRTSTLVLPFKALSSRLHILISLPANISCHCIEFRVIQTLGTPPRLLDLQCLGCSFSAYFPHHRYSHPASAIPSACRARTQKSPRNLFQNSLGMTRR